MPKVKHGATWLPRQQPTTDSKGNKMCPSCRKPKWQHWPGWGTLQPPPPPQTHCQGTVRVEAPDRDLGFRYASCRDAYIDNLTCIDG